MCGETGIPRDMCAGNMKPGGNTHPCDSDFTVNKNLVKLNPVNINIIFSNTNAFNLLIMTVMSCEAKKQQQLCNKIVVYVNNLATEFSQYL